MTEFAGNTKNFAFVARFVRRLVAQYPLSIARIIRRLRKAQLQMILVEHVEEELSKLAKADPELRDPDPTQAATVPKYKRDGYLTQLERRDGFLSHLRKKARRELAEANKTKEVFSGKDLKLPERLPSGGTLIVRGSPRFNGIEGIFETLPVGLVGAIGHWIVSSAGASLSENIGFGRGRAVTVLDWHCGIAGLLALVLDYLKPISFKFQITEVDVYRSANDHYESARWTGKHGVDRRDQAKKTPLVNRLYDIGHEQKYEFVVLTMPPPGDPTAQNMRNRWKEDFERELRDPGRLGVKAWQKELRKYIKRLPVHLEVRGRAVLVLPMGIRQQNGYRPQADLLQGIEAQIQRAGLRIMTDLTVKEECPLPQPFVGVSRPTRRVLLLGRAP